MMGRTVCYEITDKGRAALARATAKGGLSKRLKHSPRNVIAAQLLLASGRLNQAVVESRREREKAVSEAKALWAKAFVHWQFVSEAEGDLLTHILTCLGDELAVSDEQALDTLSLVMRVLGDSVVGGTLRRSEEIAETMTRRLEDAGFDLVPFLKADAIAQKRNRKQP
jgi:DNA-binding PadR family transcriptional regulator